MAIPKSQTKLWTVEDLAAMPDDGYVYEIVQGELLRMAPPGWDHGDVAGALVSALRPHVMGNQLGRVSVGDPGHILSRDPDTVVGPDIAFIRTDRLPPERRGWLDLAPDLAVEVISPNDSFSEVMNKVERFLAAGARLVWLVDPLRRRVLIHARDRAPIELTERDTLDGEDVVPGFQMRVAELFA
jgi:Uma2 family endonuclease